MSDHRFVWYELMTSDVDAARDFYASVVGWTARESGAPGFRYVIAGIDGRDVAGLMALPPGVPQPGWLGYVGTADVDASVASITRAGGRLLKPAETMPGIGRFAVVADPQGAALALFQGEGQAPAPAGMGAAGHGSWHELHTPDPAAALAFYGEQFGWTAGEAMDMGPMGTYQMFEAGAGAIGGMMRSEPGETPAWLFYFGSPSVEAAAARITAGGGTVLREPSSVPGGAYILHARDPQGGHFALVGPLR